MKRRVGVGVGGKGRNELGVFLTPLIVSLSLSFTLSSHVYEANDRYNHTLKFQEEKVQRNFILGFNYQ